MRLFLILSICLFFISQVAQAQEEKPIPIQVDTIPVSLYRPIILQEYQHNYRGGLPTLCAPGIAKEIEFIVIIDQIRYPVDNQFFIETPAGWVLNINISKDKSEVYLEYKNEKEKKVLRLLKRRSKSSL